MCALIAPAASSTRLTSFQAATCSSAESGISARTASRRVETARTFAPTARRRARRSDPTAVAFTSTSVAPDFVTVTPVLSRGMPAVIDPFARWRRATTSRLSSLRSGAVSDCLIFCSAAICRAAFSLKPAGAAAPAAGAAAASPPIATAVTSRARRIEPIAVPSPRSSPGGLEVPQERATLYPAYRPVKGS